MTTEVAVEFQNVDKNTIDDLCASKERLRFGADPDFSTDWLVRTLQVELEKINFEDDAIDRTSEPYREAQAKLDALQRNKDWLHPRLAEYLEAFRSTAELPELTFTLKQQVIPPNGHAGATITGRVPESTGSLLQVSNILTTFVPVIEDTLSDPRYCRELQNAFVERLKPIIATHRITRLCFIEKELGPVGAILMFSSLVSATGIPACIYRETHWPKRAAISGCRPTESDRLVIIYDLFVSGAGILNAAKTLTELTGATTPAALVLFCYPHGHKIEDDAIQLCGIRVESLAYAKLKRLDDGASNAAEGPADIGSQGASLSKAIETASDGSKLSAPNAASPEKGSQMKDIPGDPWLKQAQIENTPLSEERIKALKHKLNEEMRHLRAAAEMAEQKKHHQTTAPVDLELADRFVIWPERLSNQELEMVTKMLAANPKLKAQVEELRKYKEYFRRQSFA